jgi:hypothetical protein
MSPASISLKDEEVRMGRTKHGLPPRSKSERELDHEIGNIVFVLNAIDAGRLDHLFVDAETKAAVRADWMAKGEAVVRKYVRNYPGGREGAAGYGRTFAASALKKAAPRP